MLPLLSDLRVVEVANTIAAAYAGRLLADLGAEVIALEPPRGNRLRHDPLLAPNLAAFLSTNKRSATLDFDALERADDARLAESICVRAAIVLYDRTVPYFDRWLLHERVYERFPVALTVVTPWGLESPYGHLCADELLACALSGISSITPDEAEDTASERPMQLHGHQAQFAAGLTAAVAALQGWFAVRASNAALLLDVAVLDALASMPIVSQAAVFAGHPPPQSQAARAQTVPRGFLRCHDGYVYTQGDEESWTGWAQLAGRPEWAAPPFTEPRYRAKHWPALAAAIQLWLDTQASAEVYRACQVKGITCFPVNTIGQVVANPQVVARAVFETIGVAGGEGGFRAPRTPFRLLASALSASPNIAHRLGADLAQVAALLGQPTAAAVAGSGEE